MKCLIFLFFIATVQAQDAPLEKFAVPSFDGGVVTRYSPHLINDNQAQWIQNMYVDSDHGATRRKGYAAYNATALTDTKSVRGLWPFTASDGTRYLIALSSATLFETDGDGVFTALLRAEGVEVLTDED